MKKVLVILGPTATGKTDVALQLAQKYNGELVSCDSRQVYNGLDIGTGKEASSKYQVVCIKGKGFWEINGIRIWMYDACDPKKQFTVKDYVKEASKVIEDILKRGKLPIIVGGTGFYLKALLEGIPNLDIPVNKKLRGELEKLSLGDLQKKLQELSPEKWEQLNSSDRNNSRRLLRSIELLSMYPYISNNQVTITNDQKYDVLRIGLRAPREILNKRIDLRLVSRIDQGMITEAKKLHQNGLTFIRMKELGLEYSMLARLLKGEISENQLIEQLSVKIHQYAKRQMTWFNLQKNISWFDITQDKWNQKVEKLIFKWYHKHNVSQN
ncbi:MAG: tRNA (adenosine(37)-N6)-dimethylallyltransferase MiaA [Candidatus Daviesbacteria bacterium]|nr:tRNA (adenosine(37)-N6)-dimethylallyltransferase MiaA [Candidatus Daviesbacteria bacterium]